jgi:hypothetical protein
MKDKLRESKGSLILEATLILPVVFIILFALLFMGFIQHEQATMDGAAKRGALYAAKIFSDPAYEKVISGAKGDGNSDTVDLANTQFSFSGVGKDIQPYRYFLQNKSTIEKAAVSETSKVIQNSNTGLHDIDVNNINCTVKNYVFYQEITVTVESTFNLPKIFSIAGIPTEYDLEARAVMTVNDPDEFIRNTDFAKDLLVQVIEKLGVSAKIENIETKISESLEKVMEFKNKIFK